MANAWFRMYAEFAVDPKVQMLSETDQRRYIMLLCIRCNGDVTLQDSEVAFQLRISEEEWAQTKATLISKKLINDASNPINWDKRQMRSDSSAERVAKHRENKRNSNVTLQKRQGNALDTDTDTDKNIKPSCASVDARTSPRVQQNFHIDEGFIRFWAAYPKKKSKGDAEKTWRKIKPDEQLTARIIAAVEQARTQAEWRKEGGQFVPYPATWLNAKGWEDEATVTVPPPKPERKVVF